MHRRQQPALVAQRSRATNLASGRCLDLPNGNQANGQPLQVYDCVSNPNPAVGTPAAAAGWTAAWGSSMQRPTRLNAKSSFTCRDIASVTIGGTGVRIRLSNLWHATTVTFNAVQNSSPSAVSFAVLIGMYGRDRRSPYHETPVRRFRCRASVSRTRSPSTRC